MTGERSNVQKQIRDMQKKAFYTHHAWHSLNLAIVNSCSITPMQNCISQIKGNTIWIKSSPNRKSCSKQCITKGIQEGATQ